MLNSRWIGHCLAVFFVFVWGVTFIASAILLKVFSPMAALLLRFAVGYVTLWILYPHRLPFSSWKEERYYILAGITGIALYYILENTALLYTYASSVSILVSVAPFLSGIILAVTEHKPIGLFFSLGFVMAMTGIIMITAGDDTLQQQTVSRLFGDMLALLAAIAWAFYTLAMKRLEVYCRNAIAVTRRIFFYGLISVLPVMTFKGELGQIPWGQLKQQEILLSFLFLGIAASALCYYAWTAAVRRLGVVYASAYIYAIPLVTLVAGFLVLQEPMNCRMLLGAFFILLGLILSEQQTRKA